MRPPSMGVTQRRDSTPGNQRMRVSDTIPAAPIIRAMSSRLQVEAVGISCCGRCEAMTMVALTVMAGSPASNSSIRTAGGWGRAVGTVDVHGIGDVGQGSVYLNRIWSWPGVGFALRMASVNEPGT